MNRRSFVATLGVGITALALMPQTLLSKPRYVLYGDGEHDDTDALQAWIEGGDVRWSNGGSVGNWIQGKRFIISGNGLDLRRGTRKTLTQCYVEGRNLNDALVYASEGCNTLVAHNSLSAVGM